MMFLKLTRSTASTRSVQAWTGLPLILCLAIANLLPACARLSGIYPANASGDVIYLSRDLSTGNLSQWTHRDFGFGTDVGGNTSGAGYLWYHADILGRRAAGLTATPTAHASPSANSDSVYLWEPAQFWNYAPYEIWLRTSLLFPSAATISAVGAAGEQLFQPTTGNWNWFLEFHNDSSRLPSCAREFANIALTVKTDDPVESGVVGTSRVRMALRIMGGDDCNPNTVWVDGPPLQWDHWYEILLHVKWDPSDGIVEWYLDNLTAPYYSNSHVPTLYTRPLWYRSPSYTTLTLANYRFHAPWDSTIYLGPLVVGSTHSSVLGAFLNERTESSKSRRPPQGFATPSQGRRQTPGPADQ